MNWTNAIIVGRKVIERRAHNAVAITDTNNYNSAIFDVSDMGRKSIKVVSTLNQSVTIYLIVYPAETSDGITITQTKELPANGWAVITPADIGVLADPVSRLRVRAKCSVAPTSGSISTWIVGCPV